MKKLTCLLVVSCTVLPLSAFSWKLTAKDISFKLGAGLSTISVGDYNTGLKGMEDFIIDTASTYNGSLDPLHGGFSLNGEFIFLLTENISGGLGFGLNRVAKMSRMESIFPDGAQYDETWDTRINTVPITLNAHYTLPLAKIMEKTLSLKAFAGIGYYIAGFKLLYLYKEEAPVFWTDETTTFKCSKGTFGFQAGVGVELELAKNIFFGLGLRSQYAKVGEVVCDMTASGEGSYGTFNQTEDGLTMWLYDYEFMGNRYEVVTIEKDAPLGNPRKAGINLSGVAIEISLRIGLGEVK